MATQNFLAAMALAASAPVDDLATELSPAPISSKAPEDQPGYVAPVTDDE